LAKALGHWGNELSGRYADTKHARRFVTGGSPPSWRRHTTMSIARSAAQLNQCWDWLNGVAIKALTPVFLVAALTASAVAFFYPLEIETRESTVWLHVLALKAGINIYDYAEVAFINTHHGPFDSLFKLSVASLLPFLESWQVIRFAAFLLPYVFLVIAWKVISHGSKALLHSLYLGSIGYLFLIFTAKDWLFVGRNDATAALLLIVLTYLSVTVSPKRCIWGMWHAFACGAIGALVILTNWRLAPTNLAILVLSVWTFRSARKATPRQIAIYLACYTVASLAIWSVIALYPFEFDLGRYWAHFFGFFVNASGGGNRPYGHASVIWFLGSLFKPTATPESLKGGPLLWALIVYLLIPRKSETGNKLWLAVSSFVFAVCALAYYLNYYGGGQWYFIPFVIILWFFFCINYPAMPTSRLASLGGVVMMLLVINFGTVITPSLWRLSTMGQAYDFMDGVRSLQKSNTILSEDTFLFRTVYHGELIDMGDQISRVRKRRYYDNEFNKTVDRHFERTRTRPPDYIVTGFAESPELRELIKERYVQIAAGPNNLTGNGRGETRLFQRRDLTTHTVIAPPAELHPILHALQSGR
jgi:hypothetical protein